MSTNELIKTLIDSRGRAIAQMRGILDANSHRGLSGEDKAAIERLDADQDSLGKRIAELHADKVTNDAAAEQRARFEHILAPDGFDDRGPKRSVVRDALRG